MPRLPRRHRLVTDHEWKAVIFGVSVTCGVLLFMFAVLMLGGL